MNLHRCIFTQSDCWKTGRTIVPAGVMIHSTGANNPNLRRYVQPDDGLLGENPNGNHWNRPGVDACVHAFIGKRKDGSAAVYQTLPWEHRGWHAGVGRKGLSANNTHIGFEICEDGLEDSRYFREVYGLAVELTAMLCREYGLDPMKDGVVICHAEGHAMGIASNHGDVEHWFPRFGKTMDDFRRDVAEELEENMDQSRFDEMLEDWLKRQSEREASDWGPEWELARAWAEEQGIIRGDENGEKQYQGWTTRQAMVLFLYRLTMLLKGGEA